MKQIGVVGMQGVPAKYGGFETLVENIIGKYASPDIQYIVFCSSKDCTERISSYRGAVLKYIPFHANGIQSIPYDIFSLLQASKKCDSILILGVSGCCFLPIYRLFYKKRLVVNIDGLEHQRDKWGKWVRKILKYSEAMAVKYADMIIADNKGIQDYVWKTYHKKSTLIAYGGDHVHCAVSEREQEKIFSVVKLNKCEYALSICRIEPENNCHIALEAFAKTGQTLVFVGNWERSAYGRNLKSQYQAYPNIRILDSIYELSILYILRKNCKFYIHGHSAGGTNPSLVEAMFFGVPIFAYDVVYNKETTQNQAYYFKETWDLIALSDLNSDLLRENAESMVRIAATEYTWENIARRYEECY